MDEEEYDEWDENYIEEIKPKEWDDDDEEEDIGEEDVYYEE